MQEVFAGLSLLMGFSTFAPYFVGMAKGTARPHIFSWITWSLVTGIGFVVSLSHGGGAGALIFGMQSLLCMVVAIYAVFKGEKRITTLDRVAFGSALAVTLMYVVTQQAVLAAFLATMIDLLGYIPTFRKSYTLPNDEPVLTYTFSGMSFLFSLFALQEWSFTTAFYPFVLIFSNASLVAFLLIRRRALQARDVI